MSSEIGNLVQASEDLQYTLKKFLEKYQELEENTDRSSLSVEERSQFVLLYQAQDKIWDGYNLLKKLNVPVKVEGYLDKRPNGKYAVDGMELSSGSYIEFFSEDEDGGCYVPSRIEHNGEDYYIVVLGREKSIQGLKVRVK